MSEASAVRAGREALGRRLALLRKACGYTQSSFAPLTGYGRSTLANVEVGRQTVSRSFWVACDKALNADGALVAEFEALAELARQQYRSQAADSTSIAAPPLSPDDDGAGRVSPRELVQAESSAVSIPRRLQWADVEQLRAMTGWLALSESEFGGGRSAVAALAQLRWAARLIDVQSSADVRHGFVEATGNLASVAAFSAFDAGDHTSAQRCFRFGLWCADESRSWTLRANVLAEMSRHEAHLGRVDEALSLVEFAQVRADRLTATGRALLCAVRARLLAVTGRTTDVRSAIEDADGHFSEREPDTDPVWWTYYDAAEHHATIGRSLIPLAITSGRVEDAAARLSSAVDLHGHRFARARTLSRIRLAGLLLRVGDPREAATAGHTAVAEAAAIRSVRVDGELQRLRRACAARASVPEVRALAEAIDVSCTVA